MKLSLVKMEETVMKFSQTTHLWPKNHNPEVMETVNISRSLKNQKRPTWTWFVKWMIPFSNKMILIKPISFSWMDMFHRLKTMIESSIQLAKPTTAEERWLRTPMGIDARLVERLTVITFQHIWSQLRFLTSLNPFMSALHVNMEPAWWVCQPRLSEHSKSKNQRPLFKSILMIYFSRISISWLKENTVISTVKTAWNILPPRCSHTVSWVKTKLSLVD